MDIQTCRGAAAARHSATFRKDATEGDSENEHHGVVTLVEHARGRVAHSVGRSRVGRVASNGKRRAAASSESAT